MAVTTELLVPEDLLGGMSVSVKRVAGSATVTLALGVWLPETMMLEAAEEEDVLAITVKVVVDVKILVSVRLTIYTFLAPTVV